MTWTLHMRLKPPNLNDHAVNRAGGKSRAVRQAFAAQAGKYRNARTLWQMLVSEQMRASSCKAAKGKRRIVYTRIMGPREREWDFDNLVGGGKMVFDAMIRAGLLIDDSAKWCEREYRQERGAESGLRVEVTES